MECMADTRHPNRGAPNWYRFWYQSRYLGGMPSLNVDFDDAELEQIRAAARADDLSLKKFVHAAVMERASMHKRRVAEAARLVAERSAELNRRLA